MRRKGSSSLLLRHPRRWLRHPHHGLHPLTESRDAP
jgi:hypothetical protein